MSDGDGDLDLDPELPVVAASEHALIMMARALVQPSAHDVQLYLLSHRELPAKIGPTCAALLADAFSHLWPALWRRDGARVRATLSPSGAVRRGRPWQRHPEPPALELTAATLALLRWLVAMPLGVEGALPELARAPLAIGDQLAIYLALDLAAAEPVPQRAIARQPLVRAAPLAWLGFAHLMAGEPPPMDSLVTGAGAVVVEALQADLAARWAAVERDKPARTDPDALIAIGTAQAAALERFTAACDAAQRRDLAGFVIDAAAPLIARGLSPAPRELDPRAPLSSRSAARVAAGALLGGVRRWAAWDDAHRTIRFIDDGYDAAQLLLARFEAIGRAGAERAAQWTSELAGLVAPPTPSPGSATIEVP